MSLFKVKVKAATWHCLISLFVFSAITFILIKVWYPSFYFNMSGGFQGLRLMFFIDVVLGPLITLIVYNPKKPSSEIISDFIVIATLQLIALTYGATTVYKEHPAYVTLYQYGTGVTVLQRDLGKDNTTNVSSLTKIAGIPTGYSSFDSKTGEEKIFDIAKAPVELLQKIDQSARGYLDEEEKKLVAEYEAKQPIWLYALVGKYTGAYVVVDKQFNFLGLIGEKEL